MKHKIISSSKLSSFKIVFLYIIFSTIYIYTSDYFVRKLVTDVELMSEIQSYKGIAFILITALFLYIVVKKNIDTTSSYDKQIIDLKQNGAQQIEKSHDEYMSLFNHSPLPKWIFDIKTLQFLLVNDAACDTYGYTKEEFLSLTLKDIRPKEDISILEETLRNTFEKGLDEQNRILRHSKKNKEIIYVRTKGKFITFEGKKARLITCMDITNEIEARDKLTEINSKLQLASEIANLGYWTNDLIESKIQWSDEVYKIFEVNPESFELTLENIKNCFHPDDQLEFVPNFQSHFEDNIVKENERKIITPSGKTKWVLERINLITDSNGNPIKLDGIVIDITKRKLYEQEIIESNERFKIIAKATVEAIIDWDIKRDTVIWGEGFHTIYGYNLDVYDNYLWSNNIHPDDREKVLEDLNNMLEDPTKEHFNSEFRFLKANRDIAFVQHKGIIIRDENGKPIRGLAAMIDLTETLDRLHKIEIQNKKLQDIAWTQSHILRSPLSNIMGLVNLLKSNLNLEENDENSKIINYLTESTEKLDKIIHDIVDKTGEENC